MKICSGSLMDGIDIDLLEWAGIDCTEDESEELWSEYSPIGLLRECANAYIEYSDDDEFDERPGYSDRYFNVEVIGDPNNLKKEIKELFYSVIQAKKPSSN